MKLLNIRKRGIFVKAVCSYMFGTEEPRFADKAIQGYFNLCKRKMDLSKKRKVSGRTGGAQKKKVCAVSPIEDTTSMPLGIQADTSQEKLTYEDFRAAYPSIQGSLFGSAERYKQALNWGDDAVKRATDEELKKSGISFNWRTDMSKNICKNRKQNNRMSGGKLGRTCSRIRKTQSLVHPCVFAFRRKSGRKIWETHHLSQRKDFTKEKIFVEEETLWSDIAVLQSKTAESEICADEETRHRFACGKIYMRRKDNQQSTNNI